MTTRRSRAADTPTSDELVIRVVGNPAPQGSKRHVGRGIMVESSAKVKPWREAVVAAAMDNHPVHTDDDGDATVEYYPFDTDGVLVNIMFAFPRPRYHYRTGRNAHLLRDTMPSFVTKKPDLDKLLRSTLDALVTAGVLRDDAQVGMIISNKVYLDATAELDVPGAVIRIRRLT